MSLICFRIKTKTKIKLPPPLPRHIKEQTSEAIAGRVCVFDISVMEPKAITDDGRFLRLLSITRPGHIPRPSPSGAGETKGSF